MTTPRPTLALLDGHSLAYRAFYALPDDLRTTTGQVTNAVYGFTSMLIKLLADEVPGHIGVMFDRGRPAERLALLPSYKANRTASPDTFRSQVPLIFEVLDALTIPRVMVDGVEADDLIASYATAAVAQGMRVLIISGDRDVFQLVDDHIEVIYTRRGISDTVRMDTAAVVEKYGVEPARYPQLAALRGDPSDNIPGVPGVGDKTAAKLLTDFGDLDGIYAHLDEVRGRKLPATLGEHEESVRNGYRVAVLDRALDLPEPLAALQMGVVDLETVRKLFATLEFRSLWERLYPVLETEADAEATGFAEAPEQLAPGVLANWLAELPDGVMLAVLPRISRRLPDIAFDAVAVAAAGRAPAYLSFVDATTADLEALAAALADPDRPLCCHDSKELLHAAGGRGWQVAGVRLDTALAAYLIRPAQRTYDLERLALDHLRKQIDVPSESAPDGQLSMTVDEGWRVHALRALALLELVEPLEAELAARDQRPLLERIELPLVPALAGLEHTGIAVDLDVLTEIDDTLADRITTLREDIYGYAGDEFNLDSPKQLQQVLFDQLDLPRTKRIKSGYSTDAQALTSLVDTHPIVEPLLSYRELSKLKGTYVDALPPLVHPRTGRIHAEFNQTVAVTGRLSSQNPNLQNIPIRSVTGREIRRAFVPGDGFDQIVVADYSQIELRVMAHLSGDEDLLAAFASGEDIHATTAAMVWDMPIEAVDNTLRSRIKGMTYGLAYGLSAFGLSQQLAIPPDEARELMDAYFERFPKVRGYLQGVVEQARVDGFTATLFGRRRYLPDLMSDQRQRRQMAERMALNAPIQGTAADIIKLAMIAVADELAKRNLSAQLLLQVHDELVCETVAGDADELRDLLRVGMAGVAELAVPLDVDTATGTSWFDAEKH
ncbi:MAG: DNA polymerase I [Actinobacteria bacterium]|nr:DNA polymerase I [Actinomycetota bacterium]